MSKRFVPLTYDEKSLIEKELQLVFDKKHELTLRGFEIEEALEREDREHLVKMGILPKGENGQASDCTED